MIKVEGLSKDYGSGKVLDNLNLSIELGEKISLFGPNGAGKTTFLRILACLTNPTSGSFSVMGLGPDKRKEIMNYMGMAPQTGPFLWNFHERGSIERALSFRTVD